MEIEPALVIGEQENSFQGPEKRAPLEPSKQLIIEGFENTPEQYRRCVEKSFAQVGEKFGLSKELLFDLINSQVEISKNDAECEQMLAAFAWDGVGGKKLRIYEKAFLGGDGQLVDSETMTERMTYLLGHELSHAIVHTGAVVDSEKLRNILATGESDHGVGDHIKEYISKKEVAYLERYFTASQARKYVASGRAPSEQYSFAQEVIAERFHEYQSAKGSKSDFIMERIKSLNLVEYIIASHPEKGLSCPSSGDEAKFWEEVGRKFNVELTAGRDGPIEVFEKLSLQGGPLEFIKKDIDFWYNQFSKRLGDNAEKSIALSLKEQNARIAKEAVIYNDEFVGEPGHANNWFTGQGQGTGKIPSDTSLIGKNINTPTVAGKLMDIANLMAGGSNSSS